MFEARIENSNNEILELTDAEDRWQIVSINGLNPPQAQINLTPIAGMDGAKFNSSKLETRNIVLMLKIKGEVEDNRQYLYQFFRTKEWCRFYFANKNRDVFIDGRIETCEVGLFEFGQTMQVSILCPQPYFRSVDETSDSLSSTVSMFEFPFAINVSEPVAFSKIDLTQSVNIVNRSEAGSGMILTATFSGEVNDLKIFNETTGETFELEYQFEEGDKVVVNTNKGEKSIRLIRDAVERNLFSALVKGSTFFQLRTGDNYFHYLADNGAGNHYVSIDISRYQQYRGV